MGINYGKPIVIHTREAEEDTYRILSEEVPKDYKFHVHCFTDSAELARNILAYWPNAYIGITGVVTFSSLKTTTSLLQEEGKSILDRIVLETDSPFMVPTTVYQAREHRRKKFVVSHSGMIPYTALKVCQLIGDSSVTVEDVLRVTTENARRLYNI